MIELINDDCTSIMKEYENNKVDLILTDIPYGEVNRKSNGLRNLDKGISDVFDLDLQELIQEFIRICSGSIYVFCGTEQVSLIRKTMVEKKLSTRLIIWEKSNPSPMNCKHIWVSGVECCVYGKKPKATYNGGYKNTVIKLPIERGKDHPTKKPVKLFDMLMKKSSNEGDLVLDPFMGSGTCGVCCKEGKRNFIGIEKNEEYFNKAKERIEILGVTE